MILSGASSGIRTPDLCITNDSCHSGIDGPTQLNSGQINELAPDHPDQLDPPKPTSGHGSGPQSGPHSEALAELAESTGSVLRPDLARLASIWPTLPDHIRAALVAQAEEYARGTVTDVGAGRGALLLLPEEMRASIIESIETAMKDLLEKERRETRLLEESMEHEESRVEER